MSNVIDMTQRLAGPDDKEEKTPLDTVSWAPEVIADGSGKWVGNAVRLATEKEAWRYACDLRARWTAVRECRAVPSSDPVNYTYDDVGQLEPVK
jgi:hypothetical protein